MLELADIVRRHAPAYLARFGARVPQAHRKALRAIERCRTPENGGHIYRCTACAAGHFGFHSCHHRACPKCGAPEAEAWKERQRERLLPVPYFLVTFTLPAELRAAFRAHQRLCYQLLFAASAGALQDVAAVPRHLGAQLGFSGVLHTWTRQLVYHPHIHYIVPGGGLRADEKKWRKCRHTPASEPFLLHYKVLSRRFRQRLQESLQAEDPALFYSLPASLWRKEWVVHCQPAGSGHGALGYLARYVGRTALSNARLLSDDGTHITFAYTESDTGLPKTCSLEPHEFLRRFLQHVLPTGFQRVRHFGWLHPRAQRRFLRVQTLLSVPLVLRAAGPPKPPLHLRCPRCSCFTLQIVGRLPRPPP